MAGHVPKYGAQNAGNFTEVFTLARTGGKAGSGESTTQQEEHPPLRGARGNPPGGRGGLAPRRAPGAGLGGSGSGDKEGSNRPSPPTRGEQQRESSGRGGRGGGGTQDSSSRGGRKPRNVNEDFAGASHLPKFGDWNTAEAGEANYTVMFTAASKERQTGSAVDLGNKSSGRSSADMSRSSNGSSKKPSPSWWCFS